MSLFPQPQVTEVILHRSKLMATLWVTSGSDDVAGSVTVPLRWNPAKTDKGKRKEEWASSFTLMKNKQKRAFNTTQLDENAFNYPDWHFNGCLLITATGKCQINGHIRGSHCFKNHTTVFHVDRQGEKKHEGRREGASVVIWASTNVQSEPSVQNTHI